MKALREEEIEAKRTPEVEAGQSRTEARGSANFSKKDGGFCNDPKMFASNP